MENPTLETINASFNANIANVNINEVARVGGQLSVGFESKVKAFGYVAIAGLKIQPKGSGQNSNSTGEQVLDFGNGIKHTIVATDPKDMTTGLIHALAFTMEDGSIVYASQLRRSALSKIDSKQARAFTTAEFKALETKTLKVSAVEVDKSLDRVENAGTDKERVRSYKSYTIATA